MKIKPMNIIFWGALITIIGALITAIGTFNQNKSSSKKMQHLTDNSEDQIKKIERLQSQNDTLSSTIVQLSKQNSDLALQLSKSTKTLYDNITGDQSFCEFRIQPINLDSARLILIHHGNSPIYNVGIKITDIDKFRAHKGTVDAYKKSQFDFKIGDVNKNTGGQFAIMTCNFNSEERRFNVQISTRNRSFIQRIIMVKIKGVWNSATQIRYFEADNQDKLYETRDDDFPIEKLLWE